MQKKARRFSRKMIVDSSSADLYHKSEQDQETNEIKNFRLNREKFPENISHCFGLTQPYMKSDNLMILLQATIVIFQYGKCGEPGTVMTYRE